MAVFINPSPTLPCCQDDNNQFRQGPSSRGGIVTLDSNFYYNGSANPEVAKRIYVGGAGDLIVQFKDGGYSFYDDLPAGTFLYVVCIMIPTTAEVGGMSRTTTATKLTWEGGDR